MSGCYGSSIGAVDSEKAALLFGELPGRADLVGADLDNPAHRDALLAESEHIRDQEWLGPVREAVLEVVAHQIVDDDPPEVWRTAQRLLTGGLDRGQVLQQLVLALSQQFMAVLAEQADFDLDTYRARLARLPVPGREEIENALLSTVRSDQPITAEELDKLAPEHLGVPGDDPLVSELIHRMLDMLLDSDGPLAMLAGDLVVHVESFTRAVVLTHRLSGDERDTGVLAIGADLAGLLRRRVLHLPDGGEVVHVDSGRWEYPPGWLSGFPAGALLAVRIGADGTARLTTLDQQPAVADELVELLRTVYDAAVEEPWLPVDAEDLVLGMLIRRPQVFAEPAAPLTELAAAAGLECRGDTFAHEESVWESAEHVQRDCRVLERLSRSEEAWAAVRVLAVFDDAPPLDAASAREALATLHHPDVTPVVLDELLGLEDDPGMLTHTAALTERLLAVASAQHELAVAHWLAAISAERHGDVLDAESHLRVAVRADPDWPCALERLAWYESDRGAATEALALWQRCDPTAKITEYARLVAPFATTPTPRIGRNEPCWCGSGRKFKTCHLGRPMLAPLPERVGWLCYKAATYLHHRGGSVVLTVIAHAVARVADPQDPESIREAVHDPLLTDVVLHEGGWFERFLADRGPLLPDDEATLARTWALARRSVYEVLDVRPGGGLTLRDLRTGDHLEVRERSFSRRAQTGLLFCGRAVPDGEHHQLIGGVFAVPPDRERALLDLLDSRNGIALLNHVAELPRPPQLVGVTSRGSS